jgi:hypothetical protein
MPETIVNDLEQLRAAHRVRLLEDAEEGFAADRQPNGVYGFTYAPAEAAVPLFVKKTWHSFEMHKLEDGELQLVGFVTGKEAEVIRNGLQGEVMLFPDPWEESTTLVSVPMLRAMPSKKGPSREGGNGLKIALV